MTAHSPVVALLYSRDNPPPDNLAAIEELASVRLCTADDLGDALPGADALVLWDFFSRALADNWDAVTESCAGSTCAPRASMRCSSTICGHRTSS